jgi:hypothetical protein
MDTASRRAFALDSRTVWVEQQLVNSTLVARDNFVLGPGEYNAKILERHVSTPSLGGPKKGVDFFPSFHSGLDIRTPSGKGSPARARSPPKRGLSGSSLELRDHSTIFQEHGSRQPFDPKNGFCPTPGSYLAHTPALKTLRHDGVYEVKATVPFGEPVDERYPTKQALPEYDPKFDSNQLRPATKHGSFDKANRIYIPTAEDMKKQYHPDQQTDEGSPTQRSPARRSQQSPDREQKMSVFQMRCSLVPMPKLKYRTPPVLTFDDSSYRNAITNKPLALTPKLINAKAQVNLYDKILAIPRKHHSTGVAAGKMVVRPATGLSGVGTRGSMGSGPQQAYEGSDDDSADS